MKEKLLISFSGGRTSAMMTKYLLDNHKNKYDFVVVFANTGHERQATLDFVDKCDREFGFNTIWIEAVTPKEKGKGTYCKIVDYNTAYRNVLKNGNDPFEMFISKFGLPDIKNPNCSRELKKQCIRAFMRDNLGFTKINYYTALGIRSDEPKRLNWDRAKKEKIKYFAEFGNVTKSKVNEFWAKQSFDLKIKSYEGNCILCWKKSNRKLYTIIREGIINNDLELLEEIKWIENMEKKYGNINRDGSERNNVMFRNSMSIFDMVEESEYLEISEFAKDESHIIDSALQLSLWNNELDMNSGCVESCEVF